MAENAVRARGLREAVGAGVPLLLILVVAGVVRFYALDAKSLWLDEAFSVHVAGQPFGRMMEIVVHHDTPPPLYYSLLHLWLRLGDSAFNVRLLSALFGIGAVAAVYLLGRDMSGSVVGSAGGLLVALSPFQVWYAQEARMYSLLALLCALSALFLLRALRTGKVGFWVAYVVAASLATYTQISSVFFVLGEWVGVVLYVAYSRSEGRGEQHDHPRLGAVPRLLRPWLLSQMALLVLWLPWLPNFLQQSQTYQQFWIETPTPDKVATLLMEFSSAYIPHWRIPLGREILVVLALSVALLAARRLTRADYLFLLSLFLVPIVAMYLVSLSRPLFLSRVLIYSSAPFLLLVAAGVAGLRKWRIQLLVLGALVVLNLVSLYRIFTVPFKEEWNLATRYVAARAVAGELVLFMAADTQIPFDYYSQDATKALERRGLPADVFIVGPLEPPMRIEDLARMDQLIAGRDSFWLVESHWLFPDPQRIARRHADAEYRLVDQREFQGITVLRYETGRAGAAAGPLQSWQQPVPTTPFPDPSPIQGGKGRGRGNCAERRCTENW